MLDLRRRRRVQTEHEVAQRDAGDNGVDVVLENVAVLTQNDALHPIFRVLQSHATVVEMNVDPCLTGALGERFPHLSRAQPGITEFLDQRRNVLALEAKDAQYRLAE